MSMCGTRIRAHSHTVCPYMQLGHAHTEVVMCTLWTDTLLVRALGTMQAALCFCSSPCAGAGVCRAVGLHKLQNQQYILSSTTSMRGVMLGCHVSEWCLCWQHQACAVCMACLPHIHVYCYMFMAHPAGVCVTWSGNIWYNGAMKDAACWPNCWPHLQDHPVLPVDSRVGAVKVRVVVNCVVVGYSVRGTVVAV